MGTLDVADIGQFIASKAGAPFPGDVPIDYLGNLRCGDCKWRSDAYHVRPEDDCYHPNAATIKMMLGFKVAEGDEENRKIPANFPYDRSIREVCDQFALDLKGE